ncbi:MAG: hypothetical protein K9J51_08735 [Desulfotignum sp.]|nr:hypothetical protein [Desulfotignum sp.]
MKLSGKNRLMPMHQELFPDDTLFHRIARAVCRAGILTDMILARAVGARQGHAPHDADPILPGQRLVTGVIGEGHQVSPAKACRPPAYRSLLERF